MATDDRQILVTGTAPAPATWLVPGNGQVTPRTIFAHFDGTSAASPFFPALKVISDAGQTVGIYPSQLSVAAGGSADVTWFPGLGNGGSGALQRLVGARIEARATQAIADNTASDLTYDTVEFDTDGMANLGANNRILTVNTPGWYLIVCCLSYPYNNAGRRIGQILKNEYYSSNPPIGETTAGSSVNAIWTPLSVGGTLTTVTVVAIMDAVAGDFFASGTLQESGGSLNVNGHPNDYLAATLMGI